jgi:O-acetyl-ADP-ribose deacetylase (regulator of RNase III)
LLDITHQSVQMARDPNRCWVDVAEFDALLAACYRHSLALAAASGVSSIAFPSISTGVYRFPLERACRIALSETRRFLAEHPLPKRVIFCCFSATDLAVYRQTHGELINHP